MSLLDFVQENNRVRRAANAVGQLTAFFVAHVAWRGADELRDGMLFHEFRHIEANQRLLRTEQEFREAAGDFRFAYAGGAEEEEAADRARGIFESGAAAANGASERGDSFVLADDALVQLGLNAQEFLLLVFFDGSDRDAGPARDDFFDVFARDDTRRGVG